MAINAYDSSYGKIVVTFSLLAGLMFLMGTMHSRGDKLSNPKNTGKVKINNKEEPTNAKVTDEKVVLRLEYQSVDLEIGGKKCEFRYLEVNKHLVDGSKPNVLLLHGAAFSAATWNKDTGTMAKLRDWGYRAIAVTLDRSCPKDDVVHQLVEVLKLRKVILVSPSFSGGYSIPYVTKEGNQAAIAAYIPIAPVIPSAYTAQDFAKLDKLKTLAVQGENDRGLGTSSYNLLQNIPNHQRAVIPDAGHACYVDQPLVWHSELKKFLDSL